MSSFGLPPLPLPLKSISPYLQRAAELHQKDPVIAYWCAYYAAQVGISLKAKDNASRTLLLELLDVLEKLKREIGPNDAIDTESASAAYVENFALKVFSVADDEDRSDNSTRSTAKKFLAAANFLEVLKTFPKTELTVAVWSQTEGKIRYSKWKAADIAKAFREGRKPTPGAAGEQSSQPVLELSEVLPTSKRTETDATSAASPLSFVIDTDPSSKSSSLTSSPPSRLSPLIKRSSPPPVLDGVSPQQPFTPPRTLLGVDPHTLEPISPGNWSTAATPGVGSERQRANVSPRKVHFSTDTTSIHPPSANVALVPSDAITPPFVPPHLPSTSSTHHPHVPPNLHSEIQTFQAPPPLSVPNTILPLIPPPIVSQEVELTPAVVAKAQKHCRFAISALDYEDVEQAKKELRAALSALGG
ncbi:Vta1 like-domain-containing protein [Lentinula lateritia]|nr:Vta1 like-domain-containing protein [Lentinula lateritia]